MTAVTYSDGWQPIETAPKDETGVLLFQGGQTFSPCEWQKEGVISEVGFWLWWQSESSGWMTELKNPTHWRPHPEPPE